MKKAAAILTSAALCTVSVSAADAGTPMLGDLNCDGTLNVSDLVLLHRLLAEDGSAPLTAQGIENADLCFDGLLNLRDVRDLSDLLAMPAFTGSTDYGDWEQTVGYSSGLLTPQGVDGINQDAFRTLPSQDAYRSGKIVIGDSRCCQLGIYEARADRYDFAAFAVWGGHYGMNYNILDDAAFSAVEACFAEQIRTCGACDIYLFATVNDYDYKTNQNDDNIRDFVSAAVRLQGMTCTLDGKTCAPKLTVIGFDGARPSGTVFRIPYEEFNAYIADYNAKLEAAVRGNSLLGGAGVRFVTVPQITGGNTDFIADGLHYGDCTLHQILSFIVTN